MIERPGQKLPAVLKTVGRILIDPGAVSPRTRGWRDALLLITVALPWLHALHSIDFGYDDYALIVLNPTLTDPGGWRELLTWGRPVRMLSLWLDAQVWGIRAWGFHLTDWGLYLLVAGMGYRLVRDLFRDANLALFSTALFIVLPAHAEVLAMITHRKETLMTLFFFLAWFAWLRRHRHPLWTAASLAFFFLSVFSKQVAIVFPVWVFIADRRGWNLPDTPVTGRQRKWLPYLVLTAIPILCIVLALGDFNLFGRFSPAELFDLEHRRYLLTGPRIALAYLHRLLIPVNLHLDYMFRAVDSPLEFRFWGALLAIGALAWGAVWWGRRDRVVALATTWFALNLFPVLNWVPQGYQMADRYVFLSSWGWALLVARAIQRISRRLGREHPEAYRGRTAYPRYLQLTLALQASLMAFVGNFLLVLILVSQSTRQIPFWTAVAVRWQALAVVVVMLWLYYAFHRLLVYLEAPRQRAAVYRGLWLAVVLVQVWMGLAMTRISYWGKPQRLYSRELKTNPQSLFAHHNLAWWYERQGDYPKALEHYLRAIEIRPGIDPKAYYAVGTIYALGYNEFDKAEEYFRKAIEIDKRTFDQEAGRSQVPDAYINLGNIYLQRGQVGQAEALYREIIEREPGFARAWLNLGTLHFQQGELQSALKEYTQAIELEPGFSQAWFNRAIVYERLGQAERALKDLQTAARIHPDRYADALEQYRQSLDRRSAAPGAPSLRETPTGPNLNAP